MENVKIICGEKHEDFLKNSGIELEIISSEKKSVEEIFENFQDVNLIFIFDEKNLKEIVDFANKKNILPLAIVNDVSALEKNICPYIIFNENILQVINAIVDLINVDGMVNLEIEDLKSLLQNPEQIFVGIGEGDSAKDSVTQTLKNIDSEISKCKSIILNMFGSSEKLSLPDISEATFILQEAAHSDAEIIWGVTAEEKLEKIQAVIMATNTN